MVSENEVRKGDVHGVAADLRDLNKTERGEARRLDLVYRA